MQLKPYECIAPQTNVVFDDAARRLSTLLPYARIEHIGSTAIPGSMTKGDVDIFLGVDRALHSKSIATLSEHGFHIKHDTHRDQALCMMTTDLYDIDVAVQVVENESVYEFFITFRDQLLSSRELLAEYNDIKCAACNMSENEYREAKAQFIERVLNCP
ncbi:GrpB family protein [uncultured Umboniibacter sp.]|uniref:GrpB family protein n=1 Tax=uncultured Umboniibacter sp. TaxID=1798917 RepID=UPI00261F3419|nr:GrpB family protein [uncultured Umboniibacter sp.]